MVLVKFEISRIQKYVATFENTDPGKYPRGINLFQLILSAMVQNGSTIRVPLKIGADESPSNWPKLIIERIERTYSPESLLFHCSLDR